MNYENGKYENREKRPKKEDFTVYHCYKGGKVIASAVDFKTAKRFREEQNCIIEKDFDRNAYKRAFDKYLKGEQEAIERFEKDLEKEYGVSFDDKVIQIIFEKAWAEGHSDGFRCVEDWFSEYLDMIKEICHNTSKSEFIRKHIKI